MKANWFILKFEKGFSEISKRLPYELRSFFSGMLFIKIAQLINKNRSSGKSIDMLINFPSLENYYHSEIDDEIAREIKEEIYHKNLKGHNESNCLSNNFLIIANFIIFSKRYQYFETIAPNSEEQKFSSKLKNHLEETANENSKLKKFFEENTSISNKKDSTNFSKKGRAEIEIHFLKEFNQKYIKREYIDKKIIRKFRKYLKKDWSKINMEIENKEFWKRFIKENVLPPMNYYDKETMISHEFKTFSIKFMTWFFNIKETKKLYREFIIKNGEVIYKGIIQGLVKDEKKNDFEKFIKDLQVYLYDLPKIYSISINEEHMPPLTPNQEGVFIDDLFGPDLINKSKDSFLSTQRRRPKNKSCDDEIQTGQNMLSDMFHNSFSDLNISNDSGNDSRNNEE